MEAETLTPGAAKLVGMLAQDFMAVLEKRPPPDGEPPRAALIALRTQTGLCWHAGGAGKPPTKRQLLRLLDELREEVSKASFRGPGSAKKVGRIG